MISPAHVVAVERARPTTTSSPRRRLLLGQADACSPPGSCRRRTAAGSTRCRLYAKPNAWHTATRPCSMEIDASDGKPIDVAGRVHARAPPCGSPRPPGRSRARRSRRRSRRARGRRVARAPGGDEHRLDDEPARPTTSCRSSGSVARATVVRRSRCSVMPSARHRVGKPLADLRVQEREQAGRGSIRCTCTPSAANMHAYSQPITPPPITAIGAGGGRCARILSASCDVGVVERDVGRAERSDPVAIRITSAVRRRGAPSPR